MLLVWIGGFLLGISIGWFMGKAMRNG